MKLLLAALITLTVTPAPIPWQAGELQGSKASSKTKTTEQGKGQPAAIPPIVKPRQPISTTRSVDKQDKQPSVAVTVQPPIPNVHVVRDVIDWLTLICSAALVFVGIGGVLYARKTLKTIQVQLTEIQKAATQTDQMIQHAETQATAALVAANAAKTSADSVVNAEPAWLFADLSWYEKSTLKIVQNTSMRDGVIIHSTHVNPRLTCRNEGKTPAWTKRILGRADIVTAGSLNSERPALDSLYSLGMIEPL